MSSDPQEMNLAELEATVIVAEDELRNAKEKLNETEKLITDLEAEITWVENLTPIPAWKRELIVEHKKNLLARAKRFQVRYRDLLGPLQMNIKIVKATISLRRGEKISPAVLWEIMNPGINN
jgi:chromosome segregation ATPase